MFDFPSSPVGGQKYTPSAGITYQWNGVTWTLVPGVPQGAIASDTPPASPAQNQLWWKTSTGVLYIWFVDANSSQWVQVSQGAAPTVMNIKDTVLTASGTYTVPANLKFLEVYVIGGGGGGGTAAATIAGQASSAGGGGGAGVAKKLYAASALGASVPYTIGAGGTGGTPGGGNEPGGIGGNSTFLSLVGGGGGGGTWQTTSGSAGLAAAGGAGGVATGGDLNIPGGFGNAGVVNPHGRLGTFNYGSGGASFFAPTPGSVQNVQAGAAPGAVGNFPGGGGWGAATSGAGVAAQNGGAGGAGAIIMKEYF